MFEGKFVNYDPICDEEELTGNYTCPSCGHVGKLTQAAKLLFTSGKAIACKCCRKPLHYERDNNER